MNYPTEKHVNFPEHQVACCIMTIMTKYICLSVYIVNSLKLFKRNMQFFQKIRNNYVEYNSYVL